VDHVVETGLEATGKNEEYGKFSGFATLRDRAYAMKGYNFTSGGAAIEVLNPLEPRQSNPNPADVMVFRLSYGKTSMLFMGDCDIGCDTNLKGDFRADIIKISNHGSGRANDQWFLASVKPTTAVISTGPSMGEKPADETLNMLKAMKTQTFFIEKTGTLLMQVNATGYSIGG
jgi:beta-lactamase superfamily II metal-dependent hydrolase